MKKNKLFLVGLCLTLGASSVHAQASLSMEDFWIKPGETKTVTIDMENTVEIRALQVLVDLPEHIKMAARPIVTDKRQGTTSGNADAKKTLSYKTRKNGDCMIVVNAGDAVPFSGQEGSIIALTLKADDDAKEDCVEIRLKEMELVYADGYTYVRPSDYVCQVDVCKNALSIEALAEKIKGPVDVYNLEGMKVKDQIPVENLNDELPRGIYIVEGKKVIVKTTL